MSRIFSFYICKMFILLGMKRSRSLTRSLFAVAHVLVPENEREERERTREEREK
jgi:hypothetical protein